MTEWLTPSLTFHVEILWLLFRQNLSNTLLFLQGSTGYHSQSSWFKGAQSQLQGMSMWPMLVSGIWFQNLGSRLLEKRSCFYWGKELVGAKSATTSGHLIKQTHKKADPGDMRRPSLHHVSSCTFLSYEVIIYLFTCLSQELGFSLATKSPKSMYVLVHAMNQVNSGEGSSITL